MSLPSSVIASREPERLFAGISAAWTKSLPDFPATLWKLTYSIKPPSGSAIAVAWSTHVTASGSDFAITIPASLLNWTAGGSGRLTGTITQLSDATVTSIIYDATLACAVSGEISYAQQLLTAVKAMLLGNASREEMSVQVSFPGGTSKSLQFCTKQELFDLLARTQALVNAELDKERAALGLPSRRLIRNRYSRT
jgi:hypothetical protein